MTVGVLEIVTDEVEGAQPGQSYSVARLTKELSARSRVGVLGVQRVAIDSAESRNGTFGLDARVGVGDAWTFDGWSARTVTPSIDADDYGFSARGNYTTSNWNNTARVVRVGSGFNPEVGFLNRTGGYNYYELALMRTVRGARYPWLKQWIPHATYRGYYRPNGFWQSGQYHLDLTEIELADGGRFGPEVNVFHEGLLLPFRIAPNVTLPPGQYDFTVLGLDWATDPSAMFAVNVRGDFGPFYNGTRNGGAVTFTLRRGASLSTSLLLDYNDVHLDQGNFERKLIGARVAYFFTPRVFIQSLTQYSNEAQAWTANARFGWLSTAGTGLFIVFNDAEVAEGPVSWTRPLTRSLVVKYTRQFGTGG